MAAPIKPQKVQANGKDAWWWVPSISEITDPVLAEINSGSGLNITCYLLAEQEGVTSTVEKVRLARLLCETTTTEGLGEQTFSLSDIQGVFDPQAAAGSDGKKAWELFDDAASGYLVRRQGVVSNVEANVTTGQFVDVFKVDTTPAVPGKTAIDASGIYSFTVGVALLDAAFNVPVAAS